MPQHSGYARRPAVKKRKVSQAGVDSSAADTTAYRPTLAESRFAGSKLIQPGAHPEFEQPTPGEKLSAWWSRLFPDKRKRRS